jgi:hypothetical protein
MPHVQWPASVRTGAKAAVAASAPIIGDLENFGTMTAANAATIIQQFNVDGAKPSLAVNALRADLGLPRSTDGGAGTD